MQRKAEGESPSVPTKKLMIFIMICSAVVLRSHQLRFLLHMNDYGMVVAYLW